jgi:hypothetical protein
MRHTLLLKVVLASLLTASSAVPMCAQWATPTVDGYIAPGEYGTNNQLNNAGNTGQTWYMTWDASNLYMGIVNANLSEGASSISRATRKIRRPVARIPTATRQDSITTAQSSQPCRSGQHS